MFRAGQQIGIYTLISRIGRGGFGEVWLAERRAKFVTTRVAVKLPLDEQIDHATIKQEAQLWAQASGHPNILPIIEAEDYDGQIVIVSEYAPDGSLEQLLKNNGSSLPIKQAVELALGILNGLEFLHSRKIVHRDLKPANILLQGDTPRLADFGISRAMRTTSVSANIAGTPKYMAPEAFDGKRNAQTDIWSVGVLLYQMLMGKLPFPQDHYGELIGAIVSKEPAPLPESIPMTLRKIVSTVLSKNPAERYSSAREMRKDLTAFFITFSQSHAAPTQKEVVANLIESHITLERPILHAPDEPKIKMVTGTSKGKLQRIALYSVVPIVTLLLVLIGGFFLFSSKMENKLIPFRKGDKWGFSDTNKKIIVEPKYDYVNRFSEGVSLVRFNGKYGYVDKSGREVTALKYDEISPGFGAKIETFSFSEGVIPVKLNDKWGFIDKTGKEVITFNYDYANPFIGGLARVQVNGQWGFIDKFGKEIIPPIYDDVDYPSDGLIRVKTAGKILFIDESGNQIISPDYGNTYLFNEGLAIVENISHPTPNFLIRERYGFIDKTGREIIPLIYDDVKIPIDGLIRVRLDKKEGLIDKTGKEIIPRIYDDMKSFSEGLLPAKLNDKWGYIDKTGKTIIAFNYDNADSFHNGLARVWRNKKCGYIDITGEEVISIKYDDAGSSWKSKTFGRENDYEFAEEITGDGMFVEELARVKTNSKWGFIDKIGREIIPPKYDDADSFHEGLAHIKINNKYGYIDKYGNIIIAPKYDDANSFLEGVAWVKINGKDFYINKNGAEYYQP